MKSSMRLDYLRVALTLMVAGTSLHAYAQPNEPIFSLAKKEKPALLESLKALVSIETGSRDFEGLGKLADLIAGRLKDLGGKVELVAPSDVYKMEDTPEQIGKMVRATFTGKGTKKILLIAHMDTVYPRGMLAKQPFRIDGDRAYGLGIADNKQGIAVILHTLAILKAMNFQQLRHPHRAHQRRRGDQLAGLAQRDLQARRRARRDFVRRILARGVGQVVARDQRHRLRHAEGDGHARRTPAARRRKVSTRSTSSPIRCCRPAIFRIPAVGLKMNWTLANAGTTRNMIPPGAQAVADVRVLRVADYDGIEKRVRDAIKKQLLPEAKVEMNFERRRPPLEATAASHALAKHAQEIYAELGKELVVDDIAEGGGTDAAFAALNTKAPVIERFGLQGYGAHSAEAEYVLLDSIEPRLYLLTRMIMDVSQGKISPAQ